MQSISLCENEEIKNLSRKKDHQSNHQSFESLFCFISIPRSSYRERRKEKKYPHLRFQRLGNGGHGLETYIFS